MGSGTEALPLSWFASAPLLVFPLVFMVLYRADAENSRVYLRLAILAKLVQAIGISAWCVTNVREVLAMVIFLLFDGIFSVLLFTQSVEHKEETDVISD
jgi:hypothetical protein